MQAIALSLAEPSENSVAAMGAEISSTGVRGSEGTPCKKNNTIPIQDSAKNRKIKKPVYSYQHGLACINFLSYLICVLHFHFSLLLGQEQDTTDRR